MPAVPIIYNDRDGSNDDIEMRGRRPSEDTLITASARTVSSRESSPDRINLVDKDYERRRSIFDLICPSPGKAYQVGLSARIRHTAGNIFLFLLPSFITSYIWPTGHERNKKLSPTAWLDGLRGIACFIVVIYHSTYVYFASQEHVYDGIYNIYFLQRPIIKLIHAGPPMVKIFYIISGFALTIKAVNLTRVPTVDSEALLNNLSTSIWKRYLRLYLPCAASFFLCGLMVWAGWFETVPRDVHPKWIRGKVEPRPPLETGFFNQIIWTFWDFIQFSVDYTLFNGKQKFKTDIHLWTIPMEFQVSIQLFAIVVGGSMLKRGLRVYILYPLLYCFMLYNAGWALSLFLFGHFLAELHSDLLAKGAVAGMEPIEKHRSAKSYLRRILLLIVLFTGLFFTSWPYVGPNPIATTGFSTLAEWTPPKYPRDPGQYKDQTRDFWQSIGCSLTVWVLMYLPKVQKWVLCNRIIQYLGKISFSLYLMHGHVNRSLGFYTVTHGWKAAGIWVLRKSKHGEVGEVSDDHEGTRAAVVIVALFVTTPASIWLADVFWRAVDVQSVKFVKWLEGKIRR